MRCFPIARSIAPILIALWPVLAQAQSEPAVDQVQAVVLGLHSPQQALQVDALIRTLDGVLLSRTDLHTKNLFLLVRSDSQVQLAQVQLLLSPMGLSVRCWTRAPRTSEPFHHLDPEHCMEILQQK